MEDRILQHPHSETILLHNRWRELVEKDKQVFQALIVVLSEPADMAKTEAAFCQAAQIPLDIVQVGIDTLEIAKQLTDKVDTEVLSLKS